MRPAETRERKEGMTRALLCTGLTIGLLLQSLTSSAQMQDDIKKQPTCLYCGMDRKNFAHSRMLVHHKDGKLVGVCSIFCAAKEYIRNLDDVPSSIRVADYNSKKLINAITSYWVMGGSKSGVMTNRAKWAFEKKKDAIDFIHAYGGEIMDFNSVMKASYEDVYDDMRVLKQLRLEHSRVLHDDSSRDSRKIARTKRLHFP